MILSLLKYLGGYLKVRLTGYAPERFLNLCSNHNILIWNLEKSENDYSFFISVKAFRKIKPFLHKTKTKVRIVKRIGFPFWMYRYRKRKLFCVGVLIAFAILFTLSNFIWNVEIAGNSEVTNTTILSFLSEQNCTYGSLKHAIDCEEIERLLRQEFTNVIWSSVQISGTKLTVTIKENLIVEQEQTDEMYECSDIIADSDAVVDSMITRKGTPYVSAQDTVTAGDILVSGRIDIMDDNGEIAAYEYCNADADIYLIEELIYENSFPMLHEVKQKTGNSRTYYSLGFMGNEYHFLTHKKPYDDFEQTSEYHKLRLYGDFYIPISLRKEYYEEYTKVMESYQKDEATLKAENEFLLYLDELSKKNIQILEKNVMIDVTEETCTTQATVKVRKKAETRIQTQLLEIEKKDEGLVTDELE